MTNIHDLRSFIETLAEAGQLVRISKPVSLTHELAEVTATLARALGVTARLLPMSDDPVRTIIRSPDGPLAFQEYFVRDKAMVEVLGVEYAGATDARPAPGVAEAIREADVVIVCPSNPVTSIGPILAVPGIVEALAKAKCRYG